jgi:hypothetical protein
VLAVAQFLDRLNDRMDRIPARPPGREGVSAAFAFSSTSNPAPMEVAL